MAQQSSKRHLDMAPTSDSPPAKRPRLVQTEAQTRTGSTSSSPKRAQLTRMSIQNAGVSSDTPSSKEVIDSGGHDSEHQSKQEPLTRKNLARFNKMAEKGTKVTGLASSDCTVESSTAKTTSTTSDGFAVLASRNHILHTLESKPPVNIREYRERCARSRRTPPPPESVYRHYTNKVGRACNEATMVFEVASKMLKDYVSDSGNDDGYQRAFNQGFTGFPKDVGFNNGLSAPQPDFVEGLQMQAYNPFPIDNQVSGAVLYKDNQFSITLPHLAGEWKGRGKNMEEAMAQSAYDGAALVYARNQALAYLGKSDPPGHAGVTTFTTDGTHLNFYAHYALPSEEDGTLEYHQYLYASVNVKDSYQGHKDGRRVLRNEQDHARDQSYALKDELKDHWKRRRHAPIA